MSKIDEYNKIKSENGKDIGRLNEVLQNKPDGTPNPNNDKGYIAFYDSPVWDSDMKIFIHASYGYYGSSSGYSVGGANVKKYILKVLKNKGNEIVKEAINLMQQDIDIAKKKCENEARAILESL